MRQASPIVRFRSAVVTACRAVGVSEADVLASTNGISIPDAGIVVSVSVSDSGRVWRASQRYTVSSVGDDQEREVSAVLFEEPIGREWNVAKRIAMLLAEGRIDAAIDASGG